MNTVVSAAAVASATAVASPSIAAVPATPEPIAVRSTVVAESLSGNDPIYAAIEACTCHNTHPESPKHDWKVGEVRGLQEGFPSPTRLVEIYSD
jgi:hypothetical protein